jgi:ribosomal protein L19
MVNVETDRERIQAFEGPGDPPALRSHGSFTVRRIASNAVGIERTFPFNSWRVDKVEVTRPRPLRPREALLPARPHGLRGQGEGSAAGHAEG